MQHANVGPPLDDDREHIQFFSRGSRCLPPAFEKHGAGYVALSQTIHIDDFRNATYPSLALALPRVLKRPQSGRRQLPDLPVRLGLHNACQDILRLLTQGKRNRLIRDVTGGMVRGWERHMDLVRVVISPDHRRVERDQHSDNCGNGGTAVNRKGRRISGQELSLRTRVYRAPLRDSGKRVQLFSRCRTASPLAFEKYRTRDVTLSQCKDSPIRSALLCASACIAARHRSAVAGSEDSSLPCAADGSARMDRHNAPARAYEIA